jgi:hypothetical protein
VAVTTEDEYYVVQRLDEQMPRALTAHKAGVSFDIRLYFRHDESGYEWAEVAFLDRANSHMILDELPSGARRKWWPHLPATESPAVAGVLKWAIQDSNLGPLPYQRSALTD